MTTSVSIATSGSPVLIAAALSEATPFFLDQDGLGEPGMSWRFGEMPNSQDIHGREIVSAALEVSSLPLRIWVTGDTSAEIQANRNTLQAALSQFAYETTVTVDDVGLVWACDPANWAVVGDLRRHEHVGALLLPLAVTIPVQPIPTPVEESSSSSSSS